MLPPSSDTRTLCIHLVRHGTHNEYGRVLSGRAGAPVLVAAGRTQANRMARWAGTGAATAIHASPRERTMETAAIIAAHHGLPVEIVPALDEVDFGSWNGMAFADLDGDPLWEKWNAHRSSAATPGGETMNQSIGRAVAHMEIVARSRAGETILCVTHCDIIRGILAHYLGLDLDHLLRFDIDPGSVSTVILDGANGRVTRMNEVPA